MCGRGVGVDLFSYSLCTNRYLGIAAFDHVVHARESIWASPSPNVQLEFQDMLLLPKLPTSRRDACAQDRYLSVNAVAEPSAMLNRPKNKKRLPPLKPRSNPAAAQPPSTKQPYSHSATPSQASH